MDGPTTTNVDAWHDDAWRAWLTRDGWSEEDQRLWRVLVDKIRRQTPALDDAARAGLACVDAQETLAEKLRQGTTLEAFILDDLIPLVDAFPLETIDLFLDRGIHVTFTRLDTATYRFDVAIVDLETLT